MAMLVPLWFIIVSFLVFQYLSKLLFSGLLQFSGEFERGQNTTIRTLLIGHFTVVCSETWPLNGSEARGDLALIQISLLLSCKYT